MTDQATQAVLTTPGPDDWQTWRDIRLRGLRADPQAFGMTYEKQAAFSEEDWRRMLEHFAVLATVDGVSAAMGACFEDGPGRLKVVSMWTDPAYRGRGLGGLVLDRLVEHARERGMQLHLEVTEDNPALRLYERAGFVDTGDREELRPGAGVLKVRMQLP